MLKPLTVWITTVENSSRDGNTRIPYLPPEKPVCRSRSNRIRHEAGTGSKLGKEYIKAVCCHPAYLTYMQSTSCEMLDWMKHKLESMIAGGNINNLRYADDTTLTAKSKELKRLLMKVKEESEKVALKFNPQKTKIMASGSTTSWQIDGETVTDFIFLVSKITADGDCRLEIKRCLLLGRKVMTKLDNILKSRDITLPTKVHLVNTTVFLIVLWM